MWNQRENNMQRINTNNVGERRIAVAIDKDKSSQYALKLALDHVVVKHQTVRLVHVKDRALSPRPLSPEASKDDFSVDQKLDNRTVELLLPFRCFCRRRQVECETIVLEDVDVAKSLVEYVCQHGIDTLFLGSAPRNGLSRLFRATDIPSNVLKWAPDFCSVYVISKGKINAVRTATRPVPTITTNGGRSPLHAQPDPSPNTWYDEMQTVDQMDNPITCSGRLSTDSNFRHFYENLGRKSKLDEAKFFESPRRQTPVELIDSASHHYNDNLENDRSSWSSFNILHDLYEDEMRRLKIDLKQTTDMYHSACKESLAYKQKVSELEEWKRREEKRMEEAGRSEQNLLVVAEKQKTMAMEAAETVEKMVKMEVQKRLDAEMKRLEDNEDRKKVLDALGQSHIVLKYQSLYHMVAVLFLFYLYLSMCN